jgi:hypothetical protein
MAFFGTLSMASALTDFLQHGFFPITNQRVACDRVMIRLLRKALEVGDIPQKLLIFPIFTQICLHVRFPSLLCRHARSSFDFSGYDVKTPRRSFMAKPFQHLLPWGA